MNVPLPDKQRLEKMLRDNGHSINVLNGKIGCVEDHLCAVSSLICAVLAHLEIIELLPKTSDGVLIHVGLKVTCPSGHENEIKPYNSLGGSVYCTAGKCWSSGCQSDSGSGTNYKLCECTSVNVKGDS